jgi:hypothetical protein
MLVVDGEETRVEPMLGPSRGRHLSGPAGGGCAETEPPRGVGLVRRSGHTEQAGLSAPSKRLRVVRALPRLAELASRTNEAMTCSRGWANHMRWSTSASAAGEMCSARSNSDALSAQLSMPSSR